MIKQDMGHYIAGKEVFLKGIELFNEGKLMESIKHFDEVVQDNSNYSFSALYNIAVAYNNLGSNENAIDEFRKVLMYDIKVVSKSKKYIESYKIAYRKLNELIANDKDGYGNTSSVKLALMTAEENLIKFMKNKAK